MDPLGPNACREAVNSMTGPTKRLKRPADVIGNAIRVAQIATGEADEEYEAKPQRTRQPLR